jgi:hypothetical protein
MRVCDLLSQLGDADTDLREAFLFIGWEHVEGWPLMKSEPNKMLPSGAPNLPQGIDGVWLASFSEESRVLFWSPSKGWLEGRRDTQ